MLLLSSKCVKCHGSERVSGDTWCLACGAWELIGRELSSRWTGPAGIRAIADSLVVGAAREVRALRSLSAGLGRAQGESRPEPAAPAQAAASGAGGSRAHAGLAAKSAAKPRGPSEESYSYTYETVSEAEEAEPRASGARDARKGPEV